VSDSCRHATRLLGLHQATHLKRRGAQGIRSAWSRCGAMRGCDAAGMVRYALDFIWSARHTIGMWTIDATDVYLAWFDEQDAEAKQALLSLVILLQEFGPQLKRPHADTLKGSRVKNLKELRAKTASHVLRVAYFFDEERQALLLIGGDKKGKNERDFYKKLITDAEALVKRYRE
jgi:hypothetical protein